MNFVLCPAPSTLRQSGEVISRPARISISADDAGPLAHAVEVAAAILGSVCKLPIGPDAPFTLHVACEVSFQGETYHLRCTAEDGMIQAGTPEGISRAFATLAQLFINNVLPKLEIEDAPALALRGYMLDISRDRVPARRTLLHILDALWLLKYNQLQLYVEHTFAFTGHDRIWGNASPLTPSDISWLQDQCTARGIELVPNLNSLGHFGRWLEHPSYRHLSECPDGVTLPNGRIMPPGGTTLYPGPETLAFLDTLYSEYLPLFDSPSFNAGMDEPWELGLGRSAERCQRVGKHRVYMDHLLAVAEMARKHGKRLQFWADIVLEAPEYVAELPEGITGMIWGYENGHPFETQCASFKKAGVPFVVCPGTSGWNSLAGRWVNARANIDQAITAALKHGAKGVLLTDWGDNGHHQAPCISLPALALCADTAWSGTPTADLDAVLNALLLRDGTGISGRVLTTLGSLCERHFRVRIHNCTAAWKIFFAKAEELPGILPAEDADALPAFRIELASLQASLSKAKPTAFGGQLVIQELELAAQMLDVASKRAAGEAMPEDMANLIDHFEELWLRRSERGGLEDSLARMRSVL